MKQTCAEILNPRTGQRMRFLQTAADTDGALLQIESVNPPTGVPEPEHIHPHQESRAAVINGTLRRRNGTAWVEAEGGKRASAAALSRRSQPIRRSPATSGMARSAS